VRSANRSKGGKAFIVLPSTAKDNTISRIVPTHPGHPRVDQQERHQLRGDRVRRGPAARQDAKQRTQALIGIAHPDFRGQLTEAAKKMNLL
jgi:acyl-CoA hydrolase